ncbi:MAG: UBP-type zinc finger domain-containing protein [Chloroflexota bacterium]|nr:UBP-type zinc finger domain-containing protein [Chloroflexota bacterium]
MRADDAFDPTVPPSGPGCVECLATSDGWWFHLRRCARCGHVGCCDTSPSQHASRHAEATGHPVIQSYEPGEDWFYDYRIDDAVDGPALAEPHHHPLDQPVPAPSDRVPRDWLDHLH